MFDCNDIIVNAPSIRYLAGYLGIACPADIVWLVEVCKFPGSIPAMLLAGLAKEVCQAYSSTSHSLTVESLAGRVKMLTSWRSFHLDNELKQCSSSCILSVDDDNPLVALYALERSLKHTAVLCTVTTPKWSKPTFPLKSEYLWLV